MRELLDSSASVISFEAAYTVHEYVDIAKRILLEHRVREFTASDVVALAGILEARDRAQRLAGRGDE